MGLLLINDYEVIYNESDYKTISQIINDNQEILQDIIAEFPLNLCKANILYGNIICNGTVSSLSNTVVSIEECVPIGDVKLDVFTPEVEPTEEIFSILNINNNRNKNNIGIAIDLGISTIVMHFYNLDTKEIIKISSFHNYINEFASNILDVIKYNKENNNILREKMLLRINKSIEKSGKEYNFEPSQIIFIVISGTTLIQHLFTGIDFITNNGDITPGSLFWIKDRALDIGLLTNSSATIYFAPCVSEFIGGDVTTGLLHNNIDKTKKDTLYLDIGSICEFALKIDGSIYCHTTDVCSSLDGKGISCGMIAQTGAITGIYANKDSEINFVTINDTVPTGICGTGLIDALGTFIEFDMIDSNWEIKGSTEIKICDNIKITQADINILKQISKDISKCLQDLLHYANTTFDNLDEIIISSSCGKINSPINICKIGILPITTINKIKCVGNSVSAGACQILLKPNEIDRLQELADKCKSI